MDKTHYPIMNKEIVEMFGKTDRELFVDCTLGMGGHSYHILNNYENTSLIGLDIDTESLQKAKINLSKYKNRVKYYNIDYMDVFQKIDFSNQKISAILVDPGISMYQLKNEDRGFSHNINSPLDMRKNQQSEKFKITAYDVINTYSEKQLTDIFVTYGEVKRAAVLSKKIIETRLFGKIDTTFKLKKLIEKILGFPVKGRSHPAARVFQALRIYVNRELEGFENFIKKTPNYLIKGGKIALLSFHSIEDRMVKKTLNELSDNGVVRLMKPYPMVPNELEIKENSASAPAKLRLAEVL